MPDNNLGTAHGKIRIEYDGKGSEKANAAIVQMAKQFEVMNKRLQVIEKQLERSNTELNKTSNEMRKTSRSARLLDGNVLKTARRFRTFRNDVSMLRDELSGLYRFSQRARNGFNNLSIAARIFNRAGQFGSNQQLAIFRSLSISMAEVASKAEGTAKTINDVQRNVLNFVGATNRLEGTRSALTLVGAAWFNIRNRIFGINKAIDSAPGWVQKINKFATSIRYLAGAAAGLALLIGPFRLLERLASTGVFNILVKGTRGLAVGFASLGAMTEKTFGKNYFSGFVRRLLRTEKSMTSFLANSGENFQRWSNTLARSGANMLRWANDSKSLLGGIAILTNAVRGLWGQFQWFFKLPKPLMAGIGLFISRILPSALHGLGVALKATSNFVAGFADGLAQIGKGFVALPGLIGVITAGITSLIPVFKGLSDQFKDVFSSDPTEAWEAYAKLPKHLRPIADTIKKQIPVWKELQTNLQSRAFLDVSRQIEGLANGYFPQFERGATKVIDSTRKMKDELVDFYSQGRTRTDINTVYSDTAGILLQLAKSTKPVANGLRDMAVVGSDFFRTMASFGPEVSRRFEEWAAANRANGNLLRWMQDARSGIYELGRGLINTTKILYELLTLFQTTDGANGLKRFADYTDELNKRIQESKIDGFFGRLRSGVLNMGEAKMEDMMDLFRIFGDTLEDIGPFITTLADSFSGVFIPAMENALKIVSAFLTVLNETGLAKLVGWVLGVFGAFTLLPKVFSAATKSLQLFWGAFLVMRNREKVMRGIESAAVAVASKMENLGSAGKTAGNGLVNVATAASKTAALLGMVANVALGAATVFFAFFALYKTGSDNSEQFNKQLDDNRVHLRDFRNSLNQAFKEDRGLMGRNVMSSISDGLNTMMQDLESTASKAPNIGDHLFDYFFRVSDRAKGSGFFEDFLPQIPALFSESDTINEMQEVSNQARLAAAGLQTLRDNGVDLKAVLASSDTDFNKFIDNQRALGHEGNAAADQMESWRREIQQVADEYKRIGPGGAQLAEGIQQIAEAGGDATAKLDGLKNVLQALGILETSALEAAADYEQSLADLTGKVDDLVASAGGLTRDKLMTGDTFNTASQEGRDFLDVMVSLGDEFMANVSAGANAQTEYAKFEERLKTISAQTGISVEDLKKLGTQVGLVPDVVGVVVQLNGADQATQDLYMAFSKMQSMISSGTKIPVEIRPGDAEKIDADLERILGKDVTDVRGGNLLIKPNLLPGDLQKIATVLGQKGIQIPGAPPPPIPASLPLAPQTEGDRQRERRGLPSRTSESTEGSKQVLDDFLGEITGKTNAAADDAKGSGAAFSENFADGILSQKSDVEKAADDVAQAARDRMPGSPAKKGPLSGSGWSGFAGRAFTGDFATGIEANAEQADQAAGGVAGAASMGLRGDKAYEAGKFLGQLSSLVNFAANAFDAFGKLTETILGFAKFASDPMGEGTYFGKRPRFVRDPNITDEMLAQRKADEAQNRAFRFYNSGQRPDLYDPNTGRIRGNEPGKLAPNAEKQDIANYIIQKAMAQGFSREQANQFLVQAVGESGLNPTASNPAGWNGIFQFDVPTWEGAGGGEVMDAQQNIDNFFNLAAQRGLTPENFAAGSQLGTQVSIGGPWHPENAAKGHLSQAQAAAEQYINNFQEGVGQYVDGIAAGVPAAVANVGETKLRAGEEVGLEPAAQMVAAMLSAQFPGITDIGGQQDRPAGSPQMHTQGRALDVMIGDNLALGDQINDFLMANAEQLGIQSTIWRNIGRNLVANEGGGVGSTYTAGGHFDHVHVQFADGATMDVGPDGTTNFSVPANSPYAGASYGLPRTPEEIKADSERAPTQLVVRNPDGSFSEVHSGTGNTPGVQEEINPATGRPWTTAEATEFWNRPENAMQYDASQIREGDLQAAGVYQGTQEQMLEALKNNNPSLAQAIATAQDEASSDQQVSDALGVLQGESQRQLELNTAQSRAQSSELESVISSTAGARGMAAEKTPVDQATEIAGAATSIASDVFQVVSSWIETVGATKNIANTLVRYPSNTEDIFNMIDDVQKFIQLGADIAGAVGSVASTLGSMTGGSDMGITSAVGSVAGLISGALETVNAMIDLGQEAYRIIGSYVGDFLGILTAGVGGALEGNVKFLLDETTNQLLAYSADNPLDKRNHNLSFQEERPEARNQLIGNINVYGGPGQDPRDNTRQMMFQVKASTMGQAVGN